MFHVFRPCSGCSSTADQLDGHPFRAGAIFNLLGPVWDAPGVLGGEGGQHERSLERTVRSSHGIELGDWD
jgi:hypothetical protein